MEGPSLTAGAGAGAGSGSRTQRAARTSPRSQRTAASHVMSSPRTTHSSRNNGTAPARPRDDGGGCATDRLHNRSRDPSGVSSRRRTLPYDIDAVSHESAVARARNLTVDDSAKPRRLQSHWTSTRTKQWMVLKLRQQCLLSKVIIDNRTIKSVSVSVAAEDRPRKYLHVKSVDRLPHGKRLEIKMGHLPCTYIRLDFHEGTPISAYRLELLGMAVPTVQPLLGPTLETLLVKKTDKILFGSSLPASLPVSFSELHRERLLMPDPVVHLEVDDYDNTPVLLDLVLRKNGLM